MGISIIAILIFCLACESTNSFILDCRFQTTRWENVGFINTCYAGFQNDFIINRFNRTVNRVTENVPGSNSYRNVKGITIYRSKIYYFPRGLEIFFDNLEVISLSGSSLMEIRQEDLKPFKNLIHLSISQNELQILEPNLFQFNPKLEYIYLGGNKISHIDPNVFDNLLDKLSTLGLSDNVCKFDFVDNSIQKVNQVIATVQSGFCKNETKLAEFVANATTTIFSTTTSIPTTSTTPVNICVDTENLIQEILSKIDFISIKMENDLKAVEEKLTYDLHEVKDELSHQICEIQEYQHSSNVTGKSCGKVVNIFEGGYKIEPELHRTTECP